MLAIDKKKVDEIFDEIQGKVQPTTELFVMFALEQMAAIMSGKELDLKNFDTVSKKDLPFSAKDFETLLAGETQKAKEALESALPGLSEQSEGEAKQRLQRVHEAIGILQEEVDKLGVNHPDTQKYGIKFAGSSLLHFVPKELGISIEF